MWIIDRMEGQVAVCETEEGSKIHIPKDALPPEAKEGDVIREEKGSYVVDAAATLRRQTAMREKLNRLRKRS
jgi:hypothetical protein